MSDKPDLILIRTTPITQVPRESFDVFRKWVLLDGLKPSVALHMYMETYNCPKPDSSIPIELIKHTYPNIDISDNGFTFKIHDSGYPSIQLNFTDDDFDDLVKDMRASLRQTCRITRPMITSNG